MPLRIGKLICRQQTRVRIEKSCNNSVVGLGNSNRFFVQVCSFHPATFYSCIHIGCSKIYLDLSRARPRRAIGGCRLAGRHSHPLCTTSPLRFRHTKAGYAGTVSHEATYEWMGLDRRCCSVSKRCDLCQRLGHDHLAQSQVPALPSHGHRIDAVPNLHTASSMTKIFSVPRMMCNIDVERPRPDGRAMPSILVAYQA